MDSSFAPCERYPTRRDQGLAPGLAATDAHQVCLPAPIRSEGWSREHLPPSFAAHWRRARHLRSGNALLLLRMPRQVCTSLTPFGRDA
jgi:hypothetical protein